MDNKSLDPKKCFSINLNKLMEQRNVSRNKLSEELNIKYSTLCEWMKGTMMPRADKLELVANYFNVPSSRLLEDPNSKVLSVRYPFVTKIPNGYTLEQAANEFFAGWGIIQFMDNAPEHIGIKTTHPCNPTQPRYATGEPVSFMITDKITEFDKDYLIQRDGHDAEIVRIYKKPNSEELEYIMVPIYNDEQVYSVTYEYDELEASYKIIGIVD